METLKELYLAKLRTLKMRARMILIRSYKQKKSLNDEFFKIIEELMHELLHRNSGGLDYIYWEFKATENVTEEIAIIEYLEKMINEGGIKGEYIEKGESECIE